MKASKTLWIKRIVIGTAVAALPQVLLARGPNVDDVPPPGAPSFVERSDATRLPPEMPGHAVPGMPGRPFPLHDVDLSESQQDAVFDLAHAQIPVQRTLEKKAAKALDELHRLSASDRFNAKQARALAEAYAQAQAELSFNQAELDSKLRAVLTPEQRQQLDAHRPGQPGRHPAKP